MSAWSPRRLPGATCCSKPRIASVVPLGIEASSRTAASGIALMLKGWSEKRPNNGSSPESSSHSCGTSVSASTSEKTLSSGSESSSPGPGLLASPIRTPTCQLHQRRILPSQRIIKASAGVGTGRPHAGTRAALEDDNACSYRSAGVANARSQFCDHLHGATQRLWPCALATTYGAMVSPAPALEAAVLGTFNLGAGEG